MKLKINRSETIFNELKNYTRNQVIGEINKWVQYKKESYKQRRHSSPNITMNNEQVIWVNTVNINMAHKFMFC